MNSQQNIALIVMEKTEEEIMKEENRVFARNLNGLIAEKNKTQAQVADELGINRPTMNMWCSGKIMPRAGKIQMLADYFHVGKSYLIEEHNSDVQISAAMEHLVIIARMLNADGIQKLQERAEELTEIPKYKKEGD